MSAQRQSVCPSCGEPLSGTLGFCPVCLIRGMLAGEQADSGEPSSEGALKAPSDRRAPRFGHYELLMDKAGQPLRLPAYPGSSLIRQGRKELGSDNRGPMMLREKLWPHP
jgi:hypothetical protein